ncbi:mannose-1-phosphate guanylyltransferase [Blastopirellula sp. JC732]|uniref:mannose-1-phosphate guanylyltransferase n=1 Tax=Blastopirellula sediminis TaxID=2894196 RepID=A0A9X1SLP0_9BACT|nr:mannose-1-phosphate guanylyltransferase [Blastopirellula sediminis]MCC9605847.1 mannose-1-phosphate guanylyltransferase [Blastopirellula sediminis]MCC9630854.1 mannose-1-phosphate guanylyltransferase [Blastopirellula sediminis]
MLHAVIMAGGAGTRFWPASRADRPKQLLDLTGDGTMIQATAARLGDLVDNDRILVVTNERLVEPIQVQFPALPAAAIVGEPCKRDTAPCIGLAAMLVSRDDPEAIMVVMPSDHVISPESAFQSAVRYGAGLVAAAEDRIVTFGIQPKYAAETFGYIERGESISDHAAAPPTYQVARFREKPKGDVAREYFESGRFYWNSGIFIWKAKTILDALRRYEPAMYAHLEAINAAWGTPTQAKTLATEFAAIQGKSIDYAVMEHHKDVVVIEAPFLWDDVGNWQSLERLNESDANGNTVLANHLGIDTQDCIIKADDDHLIVTLGMSGVIVVHTRDATLVADKQREEDIREVVKKLQANGWDAHL